MGIFDDEVNRIKYEREREEKRKVEQERDLYILLDSLGEKLEEMIVPLSELNYHAELEKSENISYSLVVENKGSIIYRINSYQDNIAVFIGKDYSLGIPGDYLDSGSFPKSVENGITVFHVDKKVREHFYEFVKHLDKN